MKRLWLVLTLCLPLVAGETYRKLPLSFEPNQGQADARMAFLARASGYTLFVTSDEVVFAGSDGSVGFPLLTRRSDPPGDPAAP